MPPLVARAFIRTRLVMLGLVAAGCLGRCRGASARPLPSWNDGAAKKSITDFVPRVTTPGGATSCRSISMKGDWRKVFPFEP